MKPHFKPITKEDSNLLKVSFQENHKQFDYPWHYHPEYELTYILKSHGIRYVGNSIENFFEDDLVLLGSNLPHCWINTPKQEECSTAIVIYIKEDFLKNIWMESSEFYRIRHLLESSKKGLKFDKILALKLKQHFIHLLQLPPFERLILFLRILQKLTQTNQFHFLCEQEFSYRRNFTNHERINKIYRFIQDRYKQKISLAEVASQVNMNEVYFSRFFSKTMHKSFFEFLNEYRISRACKLLIETDAQVAEICYDCGYESIPFFYRQFKKFKKCQPNAFRLSYKAADISASGIV